MKKYNYEDDENIKNLNINESIEFNNKKSDISGGIDPERIINKEYLSSLGDFYKCCICFKIMLDPKDCEECGHSYCNECISKLNCPFGCKKKSLKNTSVGIINLLKNIKFKCLNEGCTCIIPYDEVKNHDLNCEYQKVKCTNNRCKKKIIKCQLENHIKTECKYSLIKCKYCKGEYFRKEIDKHEKLCSISYQLLEKYKHGNNIFDININLDNTNNNDISDINERYFNKYLKNLSIIISKIIKENNLFPNKKDKSDNIINKDSKINNNKDNNLNNNNDKSNIEESEEYSQIGDDDLVDMIKKSLDEILENKFSKYNISFSDFFCDLDFIKKCVCQLNTIEEVKESDEDDDEEEGELNNINKKWNKNDNENLNNIKELLNKIIFDSEQKLKIALSQLKDSIVNFNNNNNNKINFDILKKGKGKFNLNLADIEQKLNLFAKKINECIKETNINISNIYNKIKNEKKNSDFKKDNINENDSVNQIMDILKRIIEKNESKEINNIITVVNKSNIELNKEKNQLFKTEIKKSLSKYNDMFKNEMTKLNEEIECIKKFINDIKILIKNNTTDISNILKTEVNNQKNNIIEEIIYNAFNQPKIYVRSRSKPIRTLQPHDIKIQNIKGKRNSTKRTKSIGKKFYSTHDNLPTVSEIEEHTKNKMRSFSFNSLYFKDEENIDINIDEDIFTYLLKIENKMVNINNNLKKVPEILNEKILKDVLNYFDKLKELINNNLNEKIKNKFKLKFCRECEKVEYFYCFKKCFICNNEYCLNNIILCTYCKQFLCKECYQKGHKCF